MAVQYLKILKAKTRPIQIEPWFFRYLSAGQLKVLSAIIAHADYKTRQDNSFASNKTIAFYAGFGLINKDTKEYEDFQALPADEQKKYKNKKIKNGIQTVKNTKKQLEDLGVIKREIIDTKSYAVVDLDWRKDRYLKEFDEYFNDNKIEEKSTNTEINDELKTISKLADDGNISKENLAKQLEDLSIKLKSEANLSKENNSVIPVEDIDKTVNHIMNTKKIKDKVATGKISNPDGYKNTIKKQIENNTFNGINDYYNGLIQKEKNDMLEIIKCTMKDTMHYKEKTLQFNKISFSDETNLILANYKDFLSEYNVDFVISNERIVDVLEAKDYTQSNKYLIENYKINYEKNKQINKTDPPDT